MSTLRTAAIRLAYENPELRPVLLPLLVESGGTKRQAAKFPTDLTPYGVTAAELAAFKNKMQAMLQEAVQAFPQATLLGLGDTSLYGKDTLGKWALAPGYPANRANPNPGLALTFQVALPRYGSKAYLQISALLIPPTPAFDKPRWYTVVQENWITDDFRARDILRLLIKEHRVLPGKNAFDIAGALQLLSPIKGALVAIGEALTKLPESEHH